MAFKNRNCFKILKTNMLFNGDSDSEILEILSELKAEYRNYSKGDLLHCSGDMLKKFGLVVKGCVEVLIDDIEGNRFIMADVTPGNTFGESLCLLKVKNPDVYICATEDSEVVWLSTDNLFTGIHSPRVDKLEKRFAEMLAKRALDMNNRIQILSKLSLREKLITYFTFLAKNQSSDYVEIPFNREDMAIYVGANRTALSRELSNMKKEGIIDYSQNRFYLKRKKH